MGVLLPFGVRKMWKKTIAKLMHISALLRLDVWTVDICLFIAGWKQKRPFRIHMSYLKIET